MGQKWNLQDIRPAATPKAPVRDYVEQSKARQDIKPRAPRTEASVQSFDDSDLSTLDIIDGNSAKRKRVIVSASIAAFIIVAGIFLNIFLGGAEVTVYPKFRDVSVQSDFTIFTAPQTDELGYELLSLEATGERQVKATGREQVSTRAEGKIFVYNTQVSVSQRLIKNTRFETSDGLIYRIKESIEVPGATKDAKGNLVAGSVVADVFADATGEKYNVQPQKFTVPGLKGSEQYESIYGESTTAFTGGFEGEKYLIDEQELETAKQALHVELRDKLLARLTDEKPAGFVVYDGAVTFVYESLPATEYGDSLATIKEKVRLLVPIFNETEFAKYLAEKSVPEYRGEDVTLPDATTLTFTYTDPLTALQNISASSSLNVTLKGSTRIVWKFDEEKLKSELINLPKKDSTEVFKTYNSISHAQAEVRPFWATSFPENPDKIRVRTVIEDR